MDAGEGRANREQGAGNREQGTEKHRLFPVSCFLFPVSCFLLMSGCANNQGQLAQVVQAQYRPAAQLRQVAAAYHVRCPDVLQVDIAGMPQIGGPKSIGADGRIDLGEAGQPRVDGATAPEIAQVVAETVGVPSEQVRVAVTEYKSQYLYVFGPEPGKQWPVAYRGPETVLDLLQRVGSRSHSPATRRLTVIRPHIAEGKTPEVFHIDLTAIVLRNEPEMNILLEPFDQIHIGPSRRSSWRDFLPPWLGRRMKDEK